MKIEIDNDSGFCYGVIRAVKTAESNLKKNSALRPDRALRSTSHGSTQNTGREEEGHQARLYSLGAIVHNSSELERLHNQGLEVINSQQMQQLSNTTVLIRAHGEPPSTYALARQNNISLIDCTCPVVLKLQENIASTAGQIVIFGKVGHAEVNGLVGRAEGRAVVVENVAQAESLASVDFARPIHIFSQTTKDPVEYRAVCEAIKSKMQNGAVLTIHNTICRQVATRHSKLSDFARTHSIIIFVSGKESSNGQVLFELCKSINSRSYHVQSLQDIKKEWFKKDDSIGICGATSTPKWQLTSCKRFLNITLNNYICSVLYKLFYGNYSRF